MAATVTDLFCGAGGSSLGAEAAGAQLVMAANHWQTAIDVHQAHFPGADHDCADISQADPRRYPRTDVLMASPECTNHSQARGVSRRRQNQSLWDAPDPAAERSRATMWDVVRFAEQIRYSAMIVENVVEATKWVLWPSWVQALTDLGYSHRVLSLNSMHFGVPQSRDRIYVVCWRDGLAPDLELELTAWCWSCERWVQARQAWKNGRTVGRYRQQYVYACTSCWGEATPATEPAWSIIDWSLPCPRIGDRKRPLATKTRERIFAGLARYGWVPVTTSGAGNVFESTPGNRARPVSEPLPVQQASATSALATPPAFLFQPARGGRTSELVAPHPTVCASDDRHALIITNDHQNRARCAAQEPLPTATTGGRHALLVPMRRNGEARDVDHPVPTVTAGGHHHALLMRNNTARGDQGQMTTPVYEPARTMTTTSGQSLLVPYNRTGRARTVNEPAPTMTTHDRAALVDPEKVIDDCGFRMLEPYEVAAAMAFPEGYIPRDLTKKAQVKLAGNAVTPPVMTWPMGRVLHAMESR